MANPVFGALNPLNLGADWVPQGSDGGKTLTRATAPGANGDIIAENGHNAINAGTARYIYQGAQAAFAAAITAALAWPGRIVNSLFIQGIGIDWAPCAQGKLPVVAWTFRDGPTTSVLEYKTTLVMPTYVTGGVLVPTLLTVTGGGAEATNCQWGIACPFGDDLNASGNFLAGQGYGGEETINLTMVGVPTSVTSVGWIETAAPSATCPISSNTGYNEGQGHTYIRAVLRAVVA